MTLLLDTQVFLWFCQDDPALSAVAKAAIEDVANHKLVSIASCWEIVIKAGLGKLQLCEPSGTYMSNGLSRNGFDLLSITLAHAASVESLPLYHRDPFDRLLVGQAMTENLPIVSSDAQLDRYGIIRIW